MPVAGFPGQFVIVNISFVVINMFSTPESIFSPGYHCGKGRIRGPDALLICKIQQCLKVFSYGPAE